MGLPVVAAVNAAEYPVDQLVSLYAWRLPASTDRGLEDIGAVTRPAAVSSGRTPPAQLTTKGKTLLKRAEAAARVADEQILTHLTPAEQRQLKQLLYAAGSRATDNAEAMRLLRQSEGRPRANVTPRRP